MVMNIDMAVEETEWLLQRLKGLDTAVVAENKLCDVLSSDDTRDKTNFHERRRKIESSYISVNSIHSYIISISP